MTKPAPRRKFVTLDPTGDGDKQRVMVVKRGKVFGHIVTFTDSCSGCFEGGEYMGLAHNYGYDAKHNCRIGSGCYECGYTGKRRQSYWIPLPIEVQRNLKGL